MMLVVQQLTELVLNAVPGLIPGGTNLGTKTNFSRLWLYPGVLVSSPRIASTLGLIVQQIL